MDGEKAEERWKENMNYKFRNYNLGRDIDNKTEEFEKKLDALIKKYDVYQETESFTME